MPAEAGRLEMSGYVAGEARLFSDAPMYPEQKWNSYSLAAESEFYYKLDDTKSITITPFLRVDSSDSERSHTDIRELFFLWYGDTWEIRVGADKVFWGVIEFIHLVDVINQTDGVEGFDGEDKLGQPMVKLSLSRNFGTFDFFLLPYFRERTFPGEKGRLRTLYVVDTGLTRFESSEKERHPDAAVRYQHSIGNWDIGISHFYGTNREPTLLPKLDPFGRPVALIPYYEQINQAGLDLQYIHGGWLWKIETIYRSGQEDEDFTATAFGFEYSLYSVAGTVADVGVITEWAWDERDNDATNSMNHDFMFGARLALNDLGSTELLLGLITDYKNGSNIFTVEGGRRFGDQWKLEFQGFYFLETASEDLSYFVRNDSFIQITLAYYY